MALHRADPGIASRAIEEVYRLFPTMGVAAKRLGINKRMMSNWQCDGNCPSGYSLQQLHYAGADVIYILSGTRNNNKRLLTITDK